MEGWSRMRGSLVHAVPLLMFIYCSSPHVRVVLGDLAVYGELFTRCENLKKLALTWQLLIEGLNWVSTVLAGLLLGC